MSVCKYCNKEVSSNLLGGHVRWCDKNPRIEEYRDGINTGKKLNISEETRLVRNAKISALWKSGRYEGKIQGFNRSHTIQAKKLMSQKALASKHRRIKKNTINYNGIILDSKWEVYLAERLDSLSIRWIRPDPIEWKDNEGKVHNYFPDFYLIDYNLYIEVKNDYLYRIQEEKISGIKKNYSNIIFLLSEQECKNFRPGSSVDRTPVF